MTGLSEISRNWLAGVLAVLLVCPPAAPQTPAQPNTPPPSRLQLVVMDGEGTINPIEQRSSHQAVVRVEDENHKPIPGVAVVFTLPLSGASGEFSNGSKNQTVVTDASGLAAAGSIRANAATGKLPIHVNASYRGVTASTTITQFNMAVPGTKRKGGSGTKIAVILLLVGAAAGGGAFAATRKSGNSGTSSTVSSTPIGITPGTTTIGPPR